MNSDKPVGVEPGPAVLDREALVEQVGGDAALLLRLVEIFNSDSATTLRTIREGLAQGNAQTVERAAHRLKGALGALAAMAAYEAALWLETVGREGDLAGAHGAWAALQHELGRLEPELADAARADQSA